MTTGYSGKPLSTKLGIKPDMTVHAVNAPADYEALLGPLPEGVTLLRHREDGAFARVLSKQGGTAEFIHYFVTSRAEFEPAARRLALALETGGTLWVSWPKLAAAKKLGLPGDISEETLRELLLPTGVVDVKVCAVDETWSGLKFLWRRK